MQYPPNFGYNQTHKRFLVEASSLLTNGRDYLFQPIYDNGATDKGLCVPVSESGEVAKFQVSSIVSTDKVIQNWTLIPTRQTVERFPGLEGHVVVLLNS